MQMEQLHRSPVVIVSLRNVKRTAPQWQLALYVFTSFIAPTVGTARHRNTPLQQLSMVQRRRVFGTAGADDGREASGNARTTRPRSPSVSRLAVRILCLGAVACTPPPAAQPKSPSRASTIQLGSCAEFDEDVQGPRIDLHDEELSSHTATAVALRVEAFRRQLEQELTGDCQEEFLQPGIRPSLWERCEVQFSSQTFVSVACEAYTYLGGAHPTKSSTTMNFELPALRDVGLEDLFAPGKDWRAALRRLTAAAFARELGEDETTAGLPEGEPRSFVITAEGLRFYFEDQVPFVIGSVHPLVRWDALRPYLRQGRAWPWRTP
jgi:hypothetical protein